MLPTPSPSSLIDNPMNNALILLADDEEIVRTVVRLTLEARGALPRLTPVPESI